MTVSAARTGDVVTLTLDNPAARNAISAQCLLELIAAFETVDADHSVRALVLTGAGEHFCGGADLATIPDIHPLLMMDRGQPVALALHRLRVPTIARVDGVAIGMGMSLVIACDLIVASDRARFSTMFTRRGLSPDCGMSWLLPRLVGMHRAKELALLAEMIPAADAAAMGLVNRVVPAAELDAVVDAWTERLLGAPAIALAQTKRLLDASTAMTLAQALDAESAAQAINLMGLAPDQLRSSARNGS
ncbi:MAG: enoyl-CoA hydratase/isomerase family protein [Sporichthyaceae bacterium]